jgi:hypothetical protein
LAFRRLVAAAAADLDELVGHQPRLLGRVELGQRGLDADVVAAGVRVPRVSLTGGTHVLRRKEAFKATARRMREREEAFGPHQRCRARAAAQPLPACCATAARPAAASGGGREGGGGGQLRRAARDRRRRHHPHLLATPSPSAPPPSLEGKGGREEEEREKEGGRSAPLVPNAVVVAPGGGVGRREEAKRGATGGRPRFFSWRRQSGRFSWRRLSGRHGRFVSTVGIKLRWTNGRRR